VGIQPKGFWSYARGDDDHLDKMLSDSRKAIAGEVSMLLGEDVGIFQDFLESAIQCTAAWSCEKIFFTLVGSLFLYLS
jgi:hypothetical protein